MKKKVICDSDFVRIGSGKFTKGFYFVVAKWNTTEMGEKVMKFEESS